MTSLRGRWAAARRILVVRLDALGDVLMTTPAFRALAQSGQDVELTLLTSPSGAAIAALLPEIRHVIVHDVPWMKGGPPDGTTAPPRSSAGKSEAAGGGPERALIERLRAERFDAAVIFTVHTQSPLPAALLCHLADIPLRLAHARENPYRLLTDWVPDPEPDEPIRHETRRQLDLVGMIGATVEDEHLSVKVPDVASRAVRARLARLGVVGNEPWAVIAPGASAPSRRYPAEKFAVVARRLVREHGWRVVITGTRAEGGLAEQVAAGLADEAVVLAGSLELAELAALVATAPVVVANNSGTAHLAAAVGTPVVDLYALTNVQHAPWGVGSRVLAVDVPCKGCRKSICPLGHGACLTTVDPDAVVDAVIDLVATGGASRPFPAGILPANARSASSRRIPAAASPLPDAGSVIAGRA